MTNHSCGQAGKFVGPTRSKVMNVVVLWGGLLACALVESFVRAVESSPSSEHQYVVNINGKLNGSIHADLRARGITVTRYLGNGRIRVYGSEESIMNLTSYQNVASVEERHHKVSPPSPPAEKIVARGARSLASNSRVRNLSGEGQIVSVVEGGLDHTVCFFRDDDQRVSFGSGTQNTNVNHRKIVQYNNFVDALELGGSGTRICGLIAGKSLDANTQYNGVAPNAKLAFLDIAGQEGSGGYQVPTDIVNGMLGNPYSLGARLHVNTWGRTSNGGVYTEYAMKFDKFTYNHPDFLILAAAGNMASPEEGSIITPSTLKNGLTVGWATGGMGEATHQHRVDDRSSRGPSADGRLKPDVLAPGDGVMAADFDVSKGNSCEVTESIGTSTAAAIAAGIAALVREYYSEVYYPSGVSTPGDSLSPSGALVKATLIQSAQAVYGLRPAPSFDQGYGRVNLENVLLGADNQGDFHLYVEDSAEPLATGDVSEPLCFQVQDTQDFKVTLVWTDIPGEVNSDHALVNDLTLAVVQETEQGDIRTTQGNHRFNRNGAELTVGGVGVRFGYTTLGATLDITPPLMAQESVIGDACTPPTLADVSGKVFVHNAVMGVGCDLLTAATKAQSGGAVAMVVITDDYKPGTVFGGDIPQTIKIPVVTTNDISAFSGGGTVRLGVEESKVVDHDNNVEQVRVRHSGWVNVIVQGHEVSTHTSTTTTGGGGEGAEQEAGQNYALVITGDFEGTAANCPASLLLPECGLCLHGTCGVGGVCECEDNWTGDSCGAEICPNMCSGNGKCTPSKGCACTGGYRGDDCGTSPPSQPCGGVVTLTSSSGTITHDVSGDTYPNNAYCVWHLIPEGPTANIRFWWGEGDIQLEDGWDFVYILDGGEGSPAVIRQLTGGPEEEDGLFSSFSSASILFMSDKDTTDAGFTIQWEALTCLDDCNGDAAGTCPAGEEPESGDGTCDCSPGFSGPGCDRVSCTESSCLNGGECTGAGVCQCPVNWFGETCDWSGPCKGLAVYTADAGEFGDGSGDNSPYEGNSVNCGFYVEPAGGATSIQFWFKTFDLEKGDYMYVYDDLHQTNLLLTLTGNAITPETGFEFPAASLYFRFITDVDSSDGGVVAAGGDGFDLSYVVPGSASPGERGGGGLSISWSGWVMLVAGVIIVAALVGAWWWFKKKDGSNNDMGLHSSSDLRPAAALLMGGGGGWRGVAGGTTTNDSSSATRAPSYRYEFEFESQMIAGGPPPQQYPSPLTRDASSTSSSTWHINPDEVQIGVGLGEGFFGATYRARWRGEDVVVKKFKSGVRYGDEANFLAELNILRTLRHPRIVQFLGASLQKENMFLVMELMLGGSLHDVFVRRGGGGGGPGATPGEKQKRKRSVLRDIAAGMMYLHQQRPVVLHRDLTSGNVLLDDRWRAKVADFGVSKQVFMHAGPDAMGQYYYYGGGGAPGNVIYTAPEVLRGAKCNTASDVYSFAVVAWELFAERQPFDGIPVDRLLVNLVTQDHFRPPFEPLAAQQTELQSVPGMTTLRFHLEQWWHSDPAERPSFEQIMKGLDEWPV